MMSSPKPTPPPIPLAKWEPLCCYNCGSENLQGIAQELTTTEGELYLWTGYRCRKCGAREEV
jgi:DNA-directed RNA polymerase subunit RPC12/RpoP